MIQKKTLNSLQLKFIITLLFNFSFIFSIAQPQTEWVKLLRGMDVISSQPKPFSSASLRTPDWEGVRVSDIITDNENNIIIAGFFRHMLLLIPDSTIICKAVKETPDGFILKLNSKGQLIWVIYNTAGGIFSPLSLSLSGNDEIICSGYVKGNICLNDTRTPIVSYNGNITVSSLMTIDKAGIIKNVSSSYYGTEFSKGNALDENYQMTTKIFCPFNNMISTYGIFKGTFGFGMGENTGLVSSDGKSKTDIFHVEYDTAYKLIFQQTYNTGAYSSLKPISETSTQKDRFMLYEISSKYRLDYKNKSLDLKSTWPTMLLVKTINDSLATYSMVRLRKNFSSIMSLRRNFFVETSDIKSDSIGNLYIFGKYKGNVKFPGYDSTYSKFENKTFLAKFNKELQVEWLQKYSYEDHHIYDLSSTINGIISTGVRKDKNNNSLFIENINEKGQTNWSITEDNFSENIPLSKALKTITSDEGSIYFTANYYGKMSINESGKATSSEASGMHNGALIVKFKDRSLVR